LQFIDLRLDRGGLVEGKAVTRILDDLGLPENIEDLPRPFLAVAADLSSGREVWLKSGSLAQAVRASVAIPGVFSPQQYEGRWLIDGGVINPVPTSAVRALGAQATIAVNPNAKHGRQLWHPGPENDDDLWARMGIVKLRDQLPPSLADLLPQGKQDVVPGYMDVVSTSIDILTEFLRKTRDAVDPADLTLEADLAHISVMELFRAEGAIAEGRSIAEAAAPQISALCSEGAPRY